MLNLLMTQGVETMAKAAETSNEFGTIFLPIVAVVGFAAAAGLGSLAWYNSKRPMGWENKERPDFIPKVDKSETPGLGNPK